MQDKPTAKTPGDNREGRKSAVRHTHGATLQVMTSDRELTTSGYKITSNEDLSLLDLL